MERSIAELASNRTAVFLMTAVTATAVSLAAETSDSEAKRGYCLSPPALSPEYKGDPDADRHNQDTWKTGIRATTRRIPRNAVGIVASFGSPDTELETWKDSEPVPRARAKRLAFKIGPGAVQYSTRIKAPEGSNACRFRPTTRFSSRPRSFEVVKKGATRPKFPKDR